jgi:hypothetical protein
MVLKTTVTTVLVSRMTIDNGGDEDSDGDEDGDK